MVNQCSAISKMSLLNMKTNGKEYNGARNILLHKLVENRYLTVLFAKYVILKTETSHYSTRYLF